MSAPNEPSSTMCVSSETSSCDGEMRAIHLLTLGSLALLLCQAVRAPDTTPTMAALVCLSVSVEAMQRVIHYPTRLVWIVRRFDSALSHDQFVGRGYGEEGEADPHPAHEMVAPFRTPTAEPRCGLSFGSLELACVRGTPHAGGDGCLPASTGAVHGRGGGKNEVGPAAFHLHSPLEKPRADKLPHFAPLAPMASLKSYHDVPEPCCHDELRCESCRASKK